MKLPEIKLTRVKQARMNEFYVRIYIALTLISVYFVSSCREQLQPKRYSRSLQTCYQSVINGLWKKGQIIIESIKFQRA
ncbi:hypothetical protein FGO68_gene3841 [Halteria grandinella]|uniref:Uncharacterized protein n=1 Tax=Halteria grandinella TaxID=5974 RepID=A0A8J8P553_HALGN|nr:hypothetical protein FGO68_gene3841 [Halteria grandinella]